MVREHLAKGTSAAVSSAKFTVTRATQHAVLGAGVIDKILSLCVGGNLVLISSVHAVILGIPEWHSWLWRAVMAEIGRDR